MLPLSRTALAPCPIAAIVPASRTVPAMSPAWTPTAFVPVTAIAPLVVNAPVSGPPSLMPADSLPSTVIVPVLTIAPL